MKCYIPSPLYGFRGWKRLPYAVQHLHFPETRFFRREEWELLRQCDGQMHLPEDPCLQDWERSGLICEVRAGKALAPEQSYRFYPARFNETVQWAITGRCNYSCRHCFVSAPHAEGSEPELAQLITMLDAFSRCGIKGIALTGGEPTVRPDLWELSMRSSSGIWSSRCCIPTAHRSRRRSCISSNSVAYVRCCNSASMGSVTMTGCAAQTVWKRLSPMRCGAVSSAASAAPTVSILHGRIIGSRIRGINVPAAGRISLIQPPRTGSAGNAGLV